MLALRHVTPGGLLHGNPRLPLGNLLQMQNLDQQAAIFGIAALPKANLLISLGQE
jgi:hypothetical protein